MAFTNFYLVAGGTGAADINAGSTTGAAAYGSTSGNWDGTSVFTPTDGSTPASTVASGDYVSIYVNGGTVTGCVAKVSTVAAGVNGAITIDTSFIYGTRPSSGTGTRSLKAGGAWNTEQVLAAGGLATFTVPQSTKINITGNLTITASRIFSMAGATTAPLWFSAYSIGGTPGDLDNDTTNALTKPLWTVSGNFLLTASGAHQSWSGLSSTGSRNANIWAISAANIRLIRCRVTNTNSGTSTKAVAYGVNGQGASSYYCYFKTPSTATADGIVSTVASSVTFHGCVFDTGGQSGVNGTSGLNIFRRCVFLLNPIGVLLTTGEVIASDCTFYGCATDGIKWSGTPATAGSSFPGSDISGCLFSGLNGSTATTNGINNASGTNTNAIFRTNNDYYNVTNTEVGMGDAFAFFPQTDSSAVATSATDMTPVSGSNARQHGFPGIFENETFSSYPDIGSVQHVPAGLLVHPGMAGGMRG